MKKILWLGWVLFFVMLIVFLSSERSQKVSGKPNPLVQNTTAQSSFVGSWNSGGLDSIIIFSDGTCRLKLAGSVEFPGKWQIKNGMACFYIDLEMDGRENFPTEKTYEGRIKDGYLILRNSKSNDEETLTKVR